MLVTAKGESCDQPLQSFIIVYMVRIIISCPFYVGHHFQRAEERLHIRRQRDRDSRREDQVRIRRQQRREDRRRRLRAQQQSTEQQQPQSTTTDTQEQLMPSNASIHSTIVEPRSNQFFGIAERYAIISFLWLLRFIFSKNML